MNDLLLQQVNEALARASVRSVFRCEDVLRVGAATLRNRAAGAITATTVVCEVDPVDFERLEIVVADIADEFGLHTTVKQHPGSYSVRFSCPAAPGDEVVRKPGIKALLGRVLAR